MKDKLVHEVVEDIDEDEKVCAIGHIMIYHPVRLKPSNKCYELEAIYNYYKTQPTFLCPLTNIQIKDVEYDDVHKTKLDEIAKQTEEERHHAYEKDELLQDLHKLIKRDEIALKKSLRNSRDLAILFALCICAADLQETFNPIVWGMVIFIVDFSIRKLSHHQFGLFGVSALIDQIDRDLHRPVEGDPETNAFLRLHVV